MKVNTEDMTGKIDNNKLYAPLKKTEIKEFPALKEIVDADSDSD